MNFHPRLSFRRGHEMSVDWKCACVYLNEDVYFDLASVSVSAAIPRTLSFIEFKKTT